MIFKDRRTDKEMERMILNFATNSESVRAVVLEGSRANPMAKQDILQDFDVNFIVNDIETFIKKPRWIDYFGERLIMQTPDLLSERKYRFAYLMQFCDGHRIDLTLVDKKDVASYLLESDLRIKLLDKDNLLPRMDAPSDKEYWVLKPSENEFIGCCNEFWWVSTYIAKGLWREEPLYALDHMNFHVRPKLIEMLSFNVGIKNDFKVGVGKSAKDLEYYLSAEKWRQLLSTYSTGDLKLIWSSLFLMMDLFQEEATVVANKLNFSYNQLEADNARFYAEHLYHDKKETL
ncbi:aminoglycoside 6-adenylyltransferase [Saliterribacillus persicus]|uniref:Aminoglycoside 6-adenylyltransferase n=1 Tax=Saliterribacillus persicus TaxID=930114 RepID=A0A368YAG9_9BACI|nr:aminoglycoside 6-adenylyltransferase [Saliterribacillus persicus]RCW77202.1 aminoglycoside 6-adenylyltransferase [Saliterribacillus persicus]